MPAMPDYSFEHIADLQPTRHQFSYALPSHLSRFFQGANGHLYMATQRSNFEQGNDPRPFYLILFPDNLSSNFQIFYVKDVHLRLVPRDLTIVSTTP